MRAYDSKNFNPPAPLARVSLRSPHDGVMLNDVPMLIDSGANATLIPKTVVSELKVELDENEYEVESFAGQKSTINAVHLELVFGARTFRGRFLLIDSENGILGRNVLNHFALVLDGPRLSWQEQPSTASS
jgi:hypothetical protein